jgi:mono/diheme cytochrome c family protein
MRTIWILGVLGTVTLWACAEIPEVEGQQLYAEMCSGCHGATGRGDGPSAASVNRPVPDLTLISARNGGTFPMARVLSQIDGYTRAKHGNLTMPEFGVMMEDQPTVLMDTGDGIQTAVPRPMADLALYLEGLQR